MLQLSLVSHNPCKEFQVLLSPLENVDTNLGTRREMGNSYLKLLFFKRMGLAFKNKIKSCMFEWEIKFSNTVFALLSSEIIQSGELHNPLLWKHHFKYVC